MIRDPIAAALALAGKFDRAMPNADGIEHASLLDVGELTYGLSANGFVHDLKVWLDDDDQQIPVGPFAYMTCRPEEKARWWLERATELMHQARLQEAA